jgi:hypothetical protein
MGIFPFISHSFPIHFPYTHTCNYEISFCLGLGVSVLAVSVWLQLAAEPYVVGKGTNELETVQLVCCIAVLFSGMVRASQSASCWKEECKCYRIAATWWEGQCAYRGRSTSFLTLIPVVIWAFVEGVMWS